MAAPRIPFSKLDPARVSYRQDKGTYRIREGFVKTSTGHLDYRNFDLGADEIDARDRASKIRRLWSDLQSKGGKVWTPEALEVAEAIRMGKAEIVVEKTQAAGTSMDGCNPNDQIAEAYTQHRADKLANPVLPVRITRPVTATATSGQTLFAAIDDFAAWIRQHPNYQTKTERVEDSILSDWGGNLAKSVQRLKSGQSDMPLEYFDLNAIEQIAAYWKGRPYRKGTTRRISIDTVFDQLSSLKRFCKWCHRSSAHVWRKPEDLDDDVFTVKRDTLKTAAEKASAGAGVPFFNRDELCTIWKYATQWEKLFIILGLNCGFAQAEAISLRLNEITLEGEPPTIKRIRIKSGVYGEFCLWPETAAALRWIVSRRLATRNLKSTDIAIESETNNRLKYTNISNLWNGLLARIEKDQPKFFDRIRAAYPKVAESEKGRLSFKYLRKTAGQFVQNFSDGETAGVFMCHGDRVASDELADKYTNRDFGKVYRALGEVRRYLQTMFDAGPAEPFSGEKLKGGSNISLGTIEEIKRLGALGIHREEIADRLKIGRATVYRHFPGQKRKKTETEKSDLDASHQIAASVTAAQL